VASPGAKFGASHLPGVGKRSRGQGEWIVCRVLQSIPFGPPCADRGKVNNSDLELPLNSPHVIVANCFRSDLLTWNNLSAPSEPNSFIALQGRRQDKTKIAPAIGLGQEKAGADHSDAGATPHCSVSLSQAELCAQYARGRTFEPLATPSSGCPAKEDECGQS
jgi:hypothetical protein